MKDSSESDFIAFAEQLNRNVAHARILLRFLKNAVAKHKQDLAYYSETGELPGKSTKDELKEVLAFHRLRVEQGSTLLAHFETRNIPDGTTAPDDKAFYKFFYSTELDRLKTMSELLGSPMLACDSCGTGLKGEAFSGVVVSKNRVILVAALELTEILHTVLLCSRCISRYCLDDAYVPGIEKRNLSLLPTCNNCLAYVEAPDEVFAFELVRQVAERPGELAIADVIQKAKLCSPCEQKVSWSKSVVPKDESLISNAPVPCECCRCHKPFSSDEIVYTIIVEQMLLDVVPQGVPGAGVLFYSAYCAECWPRIKTDSVTPNGLANKLAHTLSEYRCDKCREAILDSDHMMACQVLINYFSPSYPLKVYMAERPELFTICMKCAPEFDFGDILIEARPG